MSEKRKFDDDIDHAKNLVEAIGTTAKKIKTESDDSQMKKEIDQKLQETKAELNHIFDEVISTSSQQAGSKVIHNKATFLEALNIGNKPLKEALQQVDFKSTKVTLPKVLLSPNPLHSRFTSEGENLEIIKTNTYEKIYDSFRKIVLENPESRADSCFSMEKLELVNALATHLPYPIQEASLDQT